MVLSEMLKVGPWSRLPLTVRWLDYEFFQKYSSHVSPPLHMPVCCGKVTASRIKKSAANHQDINSSFELDIPPVLCSICRLVLEDEESVTCIKPGCLLQAHLICLADIFSTSGMILPIEGTCPMCKTNILWGDLIRKKVGCYGNLREISEDSSSSDDDCLES